LAGEGRIDLDRVTGSGPHGRIVARDVEQARSKAPATPAAIASGPSAAEVKAIYADAPYEEVPLDNMRRTIAARLQLAKQTIPHFYLTADVEIEKLVRLRAEANAAAPQDKNGDPAFRLSVNDFVIKALALALQRIPNANVSWTDGGMLKHRHSDG
jgi:pyruvate dehydrogenase E2 component (dihydrolipoamide acetyltransferase)